VLVALTVTLGAGGDEVVTDGAGLGGEELDGLAGGVDGVGVGVWQVHVGDGVGVGGGGVGVRQVHVGVGVGVLTVGAGVGCWLGGGVLLPSGWLLTLAATTPV